MSAVAPRTPERRRRLWNEIICPICHDFLIKAVIVTECGHLFCGPCLRNWVQKSKTCPQCRGEIQAEPARCRAFDAIVENAVPESPTGTRMKRILEWNARPDQGPVIVGVRGDCAAGTSDERTGWFADYAREIDCCTCCGLKADPGSVLLVKRFGGARRTAAEPSRFRMQCCRRQLSHISFNSIVDTSGLRPVDASEFRNICLSVS